ncbi:putative alpha-ketoglutarate-dependent 2,4-dichlorophenoxyacetate dioxygenase [Teratosphaeria nubilosa]|uniref:Putative alpha-ketoglutarate-dependent 2,4-dichlorophenoxyacetate dioxygenase n=1 Tax=Teratosphaeria nubilosa TaxID=161662 RepID=A0A6G1L711_9PEZI|nr:putative alpha-ketoglutarate-dependent 2,4-dichlorophenoxyacetate dioxygenase [Teratosphaeria nubilosa]
MTVVPTVGSLPHVYENQWPCPPASPDSAIGDLESPAATWKSGGLKVTPILSEGEYGFGAEVEGVDWSRPVSDGIVDRLVELQDKYAVLIFRRTGLENARHIAFTQQLGHQLEVNPFYFGVEQDRVKEPFLWDVINIQLDGSLVKPDGRRWHHSLGNALWHTDSSYHQQRAKYSLLLSHGNPERGGFYTHFADTRRAYAELPEEKKLELEDLVIEDDLWHSRLGSPAVYKEPTAAERAEKPPAYHKLVQEAPNGQKTLYLTAHAKSVVGLAIEGSQKLIWELIEHCTQPKYVFSMEWLDGGDMVWWDNRQSMHRANAYTPDMTARDVRRSTVIDDGPDAFGVSADGRRWSRSDRR